MILLKKNTIAHLCAKFITPPIREKRQIGVEELARK